MMNKRQWLTLALTSLSCMAWAQGPNNSGNYYHTANGLTGQALKTKLYSIISKKSHSPSYAELLELYKQTDTRADGCVRDWYSNTTNFVHIQDKAGNYKKEGDVYNREHLVPQSWGPPQADIMHVVPTDGYVNNRRGNYPLAEVANATYQSNNGYSKLGSCKTAGYTGVVFEPNDEVKGDIARIYFYMATCYENEATGWSGVYGGTNYQPLAQWAYDMMVRWSRLDPVDDIERARNEAVAKSGVQGNRNPFVDYPGLEDYIWGDKKNVPFSYDNYEGGGGSVVTVAMPVFSPDAGSYYNSVTVTLSSATDGADIYYTTNGVEPSERSNRYEGPFTLTETATVKAVAIKDGEKSYQAMATYTIVSQGGQPAEGGSVMLCDNFFGTNYNGSITSTDKNDLVGTQNGVTVVYSLGSGQNRYCNGSQIRLYPGNTLTISTVEGIMKEVEFTFDADSPSKSLTVDGSELAEGKWTGSQQQIVASLTANSGKHARLTAVKVTMTDTDGISTARTIRLDGRRVVYNLRGERVANPTHGLYIVDGRKVLIP